MKLQTTRPRSKRKGHGDDTRRPYRQARLASAKERGR